MLNLPEIKKIDDITVYLIRHAKPEWREGYWNTSDTRLNEVGIEQAQQLGDKLSLVKFDQIFTSPFSRAFETAKIIATKSQNNIKIEKCSWLSEINIGALHGLNKDEVRRKYSKCDIPPLNSSYKKEGPLFTRILTYDKNFTFPKGESVYQFWQRVLNGLSGFLLNLDGISNQNIAIVAHGGTLSAILLILLGYQLSDNFFPRFRFEEATPMILNIKSGNLIFIKFN